MKEDAVRTNRTKMACTNCQWQGDKFEVIYDDRGFGMCPKCHHETFSIQEARDIRIERKLDKIIEILEKGKPIVSNDSEFVNPDPRYFITECDHIGLCDTNGGICPNCGKQFEFPPVAETREGVDLTEEGEIK